MQRVRPVPKALAKFGLGQGERIRTVTKLANRLARKFFEGRNHWTNHQKVEDVHSDFYGSNVVQWVDGFPLRQSLIHCESRMISNDYSLISVHGMGISGRVYNEGEARVPKFRR